MSQPNRNERLGALTAGTILVVVAAMLLFTRGEGGCPVPVRTAEVADTVSIDTIIPKKETPRKNKSQKSKKRHTAPRPAPPVRDPLSE